MEENNQEINEDINLEENSDSDLDYDTDETPDESHTSDDEWIDDNCDFCDIKCGSTDIFDKI